MKLNEEQLQDLKQELRYATKYRETYEEMYDHIVSTIENREDAGDEYVATAAKAIIDAEFGGYEALKWMEADRVKLIRAQMRHKHWENIKWFFNWPTIMLTTAIVILGYLIDTLATTHKFLVGVAFGAAILPLLFLAFKKVWNKYASWYFDMDYSKPSIKDGYVFNVAMLSCNMVNLVSFALRNFNLYSTLSLFVFVMYAVFVLSFFKLYREEYRIIVAR